MSRNPPDGVEGKTAPAGREAPDRPDDPLARVIDTMLLTRKIRAHGYLSRVTAVAARTAMNEVDAAMYIISFPKALAAMRELAVSGDEADRARARSAMRRAAARASFLKGRLGRKMEKALDQAVAELGAD
jgi:hypothetical protein